jgi:hypothetical protein
MAGNIAWGNARHLLSKKEASALDTSQVQVCRISPWPAPQAAILHALTSARCRPGSPPLGAVYLKKKLIESPTSATPQQAIQ